MYSLTWQDVDLNVASRYYIIRLLRNLHVIFLSHHQFFEADCELTQNLLLSKIRSWTFIIRQASSSPYFLGDFILQKHKFQSGDTAYIVENGNHVRECKVISVDEDFAVISFGYGGTRLRLSRLFHLKEEAEASMPRHEKPKNVSPWHTPWNWDNVSIAISFFTPNMISVTEQSIIILRWITLMPKWAMQNSILGIWWRSSSMRRATTYAAMSGSLPLTTMAAFSFYPGLPSARS